MQKITPCLWFDDQAEEAANYYVSIFDNSKILSVSHYGEAGPGEDQKVMVVDFEIEGQRYMALNGGPEFNFTEAVSFFVDCEVQDVVDRLWDKLIGDGGQESQCGWLKDKFGLSWQIIPRLLMELMQDEDKEKAGAVMQAMLKMTKIETKELQDAYAGA